MSKPIAAARRAQAERAAEHWLREVCGCVQTRRAVRTQWQKVDFFGADVMGKSGLGSMVYTQATAGQAPAVTARRRKLEAVLWHESELVFVLQLIERLDPANARRKQWFFRVHEYRLKPDTGEIEREWITWDAATPIPREWFTAWKEKGKRDDRKTESA